MSTDAKPRPKAYSYLRMSTERQIKGDSKRRQEQASRKYAEQHGLELVEEDELQDIGISAFKGRNLSKGALGEFVEQVSAGKVPKGSYLLVESFDRLSRQEVPAAFGLFMSLTNAGINIVTLGDGHLYEAGKTDMLELVHSIVIMGRAHEESKTKSERISAAWASKRAAIGEKKLTARSPGWLRLTEDRKTFELIPDKVEVVRRIFKETAEGIGAFSIVRRLNQEKIKPFGHGIAWQKSSLDKIILSKAAIGEFQPHRRTQSGFEPAGEAIAKYYPPAIDQDLFYRAQSARASRRHNSAGARGKQISNLFSSLAVCGYCQGRMHYLNKGKPPKGGAYLVCDAANRKADCNITLWSYDAFETSFLTFVEELDLEPLAHDGPEAARRRALDEDMQSLEGRLIDLKAKRDRTFEANVVSGDLAFFAGKIREMSATIADFETALAERKSERDQLVSEASRFYESRDQIKLLIARLQNFEGEGVYELRAQVAAKLKSITGGLQISCNGEAGQVTRLMKSLQDRNDPIGYDSILETFASELADPAKHRPFFLFIMKDGRARKVTPSAIDPSDVHEQVVIDADGVRILDARLETVYERVRAQKQVSNMLSSLIAEADNLGPSEQGSC